MISICEDNLEIKEEIDKFFSILNINVDSVDESIIKRITKKILFLKKFMDNFDKNNRHYKKYAIYDILMVIHSIKQNSIRNYYNYYRSFIENFIRVSLKLSDDDGTGVFAIFKKFKKLSDTQENIILIEFFENVYSNACNYVHSNIKANINLYEYYEEILNSDEVDDNKRMNMILELDALIDNCIKFLILIYANEIEGIFFRKKQELEFLIGNECYILFKEMIK